MEASLAEGWARLTSAFTPGEALFNDATHKYLNKDGEILTSGSQIAKRFSPEFPKDDILDYQTRKYGKEADTIEAAWDLKRDISLHFGNAVHAAMQLYGEHSHYDRAKALPGNPLIREIVRNFFTLERRIESARYEQFVMLPDKKVCGLVDRIVITGERTCRVQDYKTNADIYKGKGKGKLLEPFSIMDDMPFSHYVIQLNAYAEMLEAAKWTVDDIDLFWLQGTEWETLNVPRVKILEHL